MASNTPFRLPFDPWCPACTTQSPARDALWWSKAGMTHRLCEMHRDEARGQRRLQRQFSRVRDAMFTIVRMDERR